MKVAVARLKAFYSGLTHQPAEHDDLLVINAGVLLPTPSPREGFLYWPRTDYDTAMAAFNKIVAANLAWADKALPKYEGKIYIGGADKTLASHKRSVKAVLDKAAGGGWLTVLLLGALFFGYQYLRVNKLLKKGL